MRLLLLFLLLSTQFPIRAAGIFAPANQYSDTAREGHLRRARALLSEALDLMHRFYYNRQNFDWYRFTETVKSRLDKSGKGDDVYQLINQCLREMGETHSFIMAPGKVSVYENRNHAAAALPLSSFLGELRGFEAAPGIGYLKVPWVRSTDDSICRLVADSLQHLIAGLDKNGDHRWIIDLRANSGGNCWPMLTGLGPLLGEGVCGYFISGTEEIPISYQNGAARQGKNIRCQISGLPYCARSSENYIAVLTGPGTSSAGEIVTIAFKGKKNVSFFGNPTAGFTTANGTYSLADNSLLVLSVCREADRSGYVYQGRIRPDEELSLRQAGTSSDPAMDAALMWLQSL